MIQTVRHLYIDANLSLMGIGGFSPATPPYKVGLRAVLQLPYYASIYKIGNYCSYINGVAEDGCIVAKLDDTRFADIPIGNPIPIGGYAYNGPKFETSNGADVSKVRTFQQYFKHYSGFIFEGRYVPLGKYLPSLPTQMEGYYTSWAYYLLDANDNIICQVPSNANGKNIVCYAGYPFLSKDMTYLYSSFDGIKDIGFLPSNSISAPLVYYGNIQYIRILLALMGIATMPESFMISVCSSPGIADNVISNLTHYTPIISKPLACQIQEVDPAYACGNIKMLVNDYPIGPYAPIGTYPYITFIHSAHRIISAAQTIRNSCSADAVVTYTGYINYKHDTPLFSV